MKFSELPIAACLTLGLFFAHGALAETPFAAYGVSVIGPKSCSGGATTGLRCATLGTPLPPYILVGGYDQPGDGGGGYFALDTSLSTCTDNGGSVIENFRSDICYYRMSSPNDIRQWGAHCDVVPEFNTGIFEYSGTGPYTFNAGSASLNNTRDSGKYIVIPLIGAGPYYPFHAAISTPGSGYSVGDQLTFNGGTLTSPIPATLVVDTVTTSGTLGQVTAFHFLNYGAYSIPAGTSLTSGGTTVTLLGGSGTLARGPARQRAPSSLL
ncbi:MAG: hypothetical protein ACREP9_19605 [Candidatus Dormibacteraceae bacterium]